MSYRATFLFLLCLTFLLPGATFASPTTYYVDSDNGNDDWSGTVPDGVFSPVGCQDDPDITCNDGPWQTVEKVNTAGTLLLPGDSVLFKRGRVWNEGLVVPVSGTESAPITFGAYGSGNPPAFDGLVGGVYRFDYGITTNQQRYLLIRDLAVYRSASFGVRVYMPTVRDSAFVTVDNLHVEDIGDRSLTRGPQGITVGASDVRILNSVIKHVISNGVYARGRNIEIGYNHISNVEEGGFGGDCIHIDQPESEGYWVHHNYLDHTNSGIKGCFVGTDHGDPALPRVGGIFEHNVCIADANHGFNDLAPNAIVRYNWIENRGGSAIGVNSTNGSYYYNVIVNTPTAFYIRGPANGVNDGRMTNARVFNNSIYNVDRVVDANAPSDRYVEFGFFNNAIHMAPGGVAYVVSTTADMASGNNNLYPERTRFIVYKGTLFDTLSAFTVATGLDSGSSPAAPGFVDPATGDLHLNPLTTDAIDRATVIVDGQSRDFEGVPVPAGSGPDVGAFEYRVAHLHALSGAAPGQVDLTAQGTVDWIHFGHDGPTSYNRKADVEPLIEPFAVEGGVSEQGMNFSAAAYSWNDGDPQGAVDGSRTVALIHEPGAAFRFTVPADVLERTLTIYAGARKARGVLRLELSDGSVVPLEIAIETDKGKTKTEAVQVVFRAPKKGESLMVTYRLAASHGGGARISLDAAALSLSE